MRHISPPSALLAGSLVLLMAGCASPATGSRGPSSGPILQEQVEASTARSAYDLIQQLRPSWLRGRGTQSIQNPGSSFPVVYVNGIRESSLDALRTLDVGLVREVEYLSASQATTRFGTGHTGGAILVHLRR